MIRAKCGASRSATIPQQGQRTSQYPGITCLSSQRIQRPCLWKSLVRVLDTCASESPRWLQSSRRKYRREVPQMLEVQAYDENLLGLYVERRDSGSSGLQP